MERAEIERRIDTPSTAFELEPLMGAEPFRPVRRAEAAHRLCASATAAGPRLVVVLDEPSSNLDFPSMAHLRAAVERWKREGCTVLVAEHRLHFLTDLVDRAYYLRDGAVERQWSRNRAALSLDDRAGRARAANAAALRGVRAALAAAEPAEPAGTFALDGFFSPTAAALSLRARSSTRSCRDDAVVAVINANGAGKSTFANALCGLNRKGPHRRRTRPLAPLRAQASCFQVMQDANHQLFAEEVLDEVLLNIAKPDEGSSPHRSGGRLEPLSRRGMFHPLSLSRARGSSGRASRPPWPTNAGDRRRRAPRAGSTSTRTRAGPWLIHDVRSRGAAQLVITHDPEFIMACCSWVVRLEDRGIMESYPLDAAERVG